MLFAIVVAAGQGRRMGFKKQFIHLAGQPMWVRSMEAMFAGGAEHTFVVAGEEDMQMMQETLARSRWSTRATLVIGGETRHDSVKAGMLQIYQTITQRKFALPSVLVGVHDAARPFVTALDVKRAFHQASDTGAALLGRACRDTVKWIENGVVARTIPRDQLFLAETPQIVRGDYIERAYLNSGQLLSPSDDSALLESLGLTVAYVESTSYNGKVTTPADLDYAHWLAEKMWGDEAQS